MIKLKENILTYSELKDSQIDWIGKIPEHWKVSSLRFFSEIKRGCGYQLLIPYEENKETTYEKVIRIGDFDIFNPIKFIYDSNFENYRIKEGDILIGGTGHYFGKSILANKKMNNYVHSYNIIRINLKKNIPNFVENYLSSSEIRDQLNISALGSGQPFIDIQSLKELKILIPPIEEQTLISKYLDKKTKKIDSLIGKIGKKIELLKEQKNALINQYITKGLDPNVEMKDSGIEWIGQFPKHWELIKIGHYSTIVRGSSPRPAGDPKLFNGDFIPWITVNEVTNAQSKYITSTKRFLTEEGGKRSRLVKSGTLLFSNSGATLGVPKFTMIDGCINDGSVAFENINQKIEPDFLFFFLSTQTVRLREVQSGYGQPNLNTEIVSNIKMPCPPRNEQKKITCEIERTNNKLTKTINLLIKKSELLNEYRQSLISSVVTGKIRIKEDML